MKPYYDDGNGIVIYHGDCREIFPGLPKVDAVVTDPPYGINFENHDKEVESLRPSGWRIFGDDTQEIGQSILDMFSQTATIAFASPKKPWSGSWSQHLVWWKGPAVGGGGDGSTYWKLDHELIQVRRLGKLNGLRDSSVIVDWITSRSSPEHPAQKPLSLMKLLISKFNAVTILDPFMGSGTTLVAAKNLGRKAIGIEIEERYCEIAVKRLRQEVFSFDNPKVSASESAATHGARAMKTIAAS